MLKYRAFKESASIMLWKIYKLLLLSLIIITVCGSALSAQQLEDRNGDERIVVDGFGDSIAFGFGDGTTPGQYIEEAPRTDGTLGFLQRLRKWMGVRTNNFGEPGELITEEGVQRFPTIARNSSSDYIGIIEGINDARLLVSPGKYNRALQKMVNVAVALGKTPIVFTTPPSCCDRSGSESIAGAYSAEATKIASLNAIPLADTARAWRSTCPDLSECSLYNRPEGLHPNARGYAAIAQVLLSALLDIDIFVDTKQAELADALGLTPEQIVVKPDTTETK